MRLILASSSPRRKAILNLMGVAFETVAPEVTEVFEPRRPAPDEASHWAFQKARWVAARNPDSLVLGSDTLIDLDRQKIGKPKNSEEALAILKRMAGRSHWVVTAVGAILPDGRERRAIEVAQVEMRSATESELADYVASGDPLDKAGAYSLQGPGAKFISKIDGDFLAVVGFPLRPVARILREAKIPIPVSVESIYENRDFLNWRQFNPV